MKGKYKINEVAKMLGVSASAIRFYEKKGLFSALKNEENGYRTFDDHDVYKIWSIIYHRNIDLSVNDIYRLKHSGTLGDVAEMIAQQKADTLERITAEQRKLAVFQYYDRLIEKAQRHKEPPLKLDTGDLYFFQRRAFYESCCSTFPVSNPCDVFLSSKQRNEDGTDFCLIFGEDMDIVAPEDRSKVEKMVPSFRGLSVIVSFEGDFDPGKAFSLALEKAAGDEWEPAFPCYVIYLMSTGDWEHAVRYYEVLLPLPDAE